MTALGVRGFAGVREVVVALKLSVSAPFRFVSHDPLGVGGVSWRKTSSFGAVPILE